MVLWNGNELTTIPRAIASGMFGERNTGLCSDGMTEKKRGHGMEYPDDEVHGGLRDRVFLFYLVLSVYLSFCFLWFLRRSSGCG
jgi:hypothetical protein